MEDYRATQPEATQPEAMGAKETVREYAKRHNFPISKFSNTALEGLPMIRELQEDPDSRRIKSRPKELKGKDIWEFITKKCDMMAIYIQLSGTKAKEPCNRCRQDSGPWTMCVTTQDEATLHTYKGACGCCIWGGKSTYCSFRQDKATSATKKALHRRTRGESTVGLTQEPQVENTDGNRQRNGTERVAKQQNQVLGRDSPGFINWKKEQMQAYLKRLDKEFRRLATHEPEDKEEELVASWEILIGLVMETESITHPS